MSEAESARTFLDQVIKVFPDFITADEALETARKVRELQPHWVAFGSDPQHPYMYRIGAANYLDTAHELYRQRRDLFNPLFEVAFASLYQKLISFFEAHFQCAVVKPEALAWPGFHIYHGTTMPNGGRVHVDRGQHEWVRRFFSPDVNTDDAYSFTLAVELTEGSGLRLWDIQPEETKMFPPQGWKEHVAGRKFYEVTYQVGGLYLFHSNYVHQIAPNHAPVSEKRRITLQGHLLRANDGSLLMFW